MSGHLKDFVFPTESLHLVFTQRCSVTLLAYRKRWPKIVSQEPHLLNSKRGQLT